MRLPSDALAFKEEDGSVVVVYIDNLGMGDAGLVISEDGGQTFRRLRATNYKRPGADPTIHTLELGDAIFSRIQREGDKLKLSRFAAPMLQLTLTPAPSNIEMEPAPEALAAQAA